MRIGSNIARLVGRGTSIVLFALAIGVGIALRLDQFASQLLLEDEWHAVYRVVHDAPSAIFLDFGHSDSSIPLTLLYFAEAHAFGLSELAMRWPTMLAGIATLVLFPWYLARHVGRAEALLFAALLSISPILYFFSRMARPYALTLILVYVAHVAFRRYVEAGTPRRSDAALYAGSAALAAWLHPVVVPFAIAPFVPAAWRWLRAGGRERTALVRLATLAIAAGVPMVAILLPPLLAHPESLSLKSGLDLPRADTLAGIWYSWFGTGSTTVLVLCAALAIVGAPAVWQRLPETRSILAGVALSALMIAVTRPAWIGNALTLGRYLLPVLPLLLLATACGALRLARAVAAGIKARHPLAAASLSSAIGAVPLVALALTTPLAPVLAHPNANSLHLLYEFDFRPDHNPVIGHMQLIPLSSWWVTLASRPPSSLTMAVVPFPEGSVGWDAPRWQRSSRQRILSGFLTPLCASARETEVPDDARFAFRNTVHLGDATELAAHRVDYVVWQKPYRYVGRGLDVQVAADVAACGPALRAHFGAPAYEDEWLAVYRVSGAPADARR
jgi:mannosyltransferase